MFRPIGPRAIFGFAVVALGFGCSSAATPGGGTGGSGGAGAALAYTPCAPGTRAGEFILELVAASIPPSTPRPAYSQIRGAVRDRPDPGENWQKLAEEGACQAKIGPTLVCNSPACSGGQVCAGSNSCIPEPATQDLGTVSVTGLAVPITLVKLGTTHKYSNPPSLTSAPYPPFGSAPEIRLQTSGGAYPGFSLSGRKITPLEFAGTGLHLAKVPQALQVTWTSPPAGSSTRMVVEVDIAHYGGISAVVECDVPDNGATTVPASLLAKLLERGTAGFPQIKLTRRTVDSITIAPGCVEFEVASPVTRDLAVEGVVSCSEETPCPDNLGCRTDLTCAPCSATSLCPYGQACRTDVKCGACDATNPCPTDQVCQGDKTCS